MGYLIRAMIVSLLQWVVIMGAITVINWKLFTKLGHEGWKCLIPIYNGYLLFEKVFGDGAKVFLMLIPFYNIYLFYLYCKGLAEGFGKDPVFTWLLFFLQPVGLAVLAFDKGEWIGLESEGVEPAPVKQPKQAKKPVKQTKPQPEPKRSLQSKQATKKPARKPVPEPEPVYEDEEDYGSEEEYAESVDYSEEYAEPVDYGAEEEYVEEEPEMDEATKRKVARLNQLYKEGKISEAQYNAKLQQLTSSTYR